MNVPSIRVADADGCPVPLERDTNYLSLAQIKDPVEFSNACRAFYKTRVEATAKMKELVRRGIGANSFSSASSSSSSGISSLNSNLDDSVTGVKENYDGWGDPLDGDLNSSVTSCVHKGEQARARRRSNRDRPTMDSSMDILRREMAALMELDLHLMKQLLTLNEEIEDLKWRRQRAWVDNCESSQEGSWDMMQSAASLSNKLEPALKFSTPSSLSLQLEDNETLRFSVYDDDDYTNTFNRGKNKQNHILKGPRTIPEVHAATPSISAIPSGKTNVAQNQDNRDRTNEVELNGKTSTLYDGVKTVKPQTQNNNSLVVSSKDCENSKRQEGTSVVEQSGANEKPNIEFPNTTPISSVSAAETSNDHSQDSGYVPRGVTHLKDKYQLASGKYDNVTARAGAVNDTSTYSGANVSPMCQVSSDGNDVAQSCQKSCKNDLQKTHSPSTSKSITRSIPLETLGCNAATTNPTQALATVNHEHAVPSNHQNGPLRSSASRLHSNIADPNPTPPMSGHRKRNKNRFVFRPGAGDLKHSAGGVLRHSKKKTKGASIASNGDAESHDSGINDVYN